MSRINVTFEDHIGRYSVYNIRVDGNVVASVYGPMAAIATEAVCRYLENDKGTIKVGDVFERVQAGGDSNDDESENRNL